MSIAFAGGSGAFTVCSHLGGSGGGCCQFMQYLDRWDCASLRLVCKELYDMTKEYEVYVAAMAMRPSNYASKRTLSQHNTRPESLGPLAWPLGRLQGRTTRVIDNPSALAGIVRRPNGNIVTAACASGQVLEYSDKYNLLRILADGLERPTGLALMSDGSVLVAETDAHCIRILASGCTYVGTSAPILAGAFGIQGHVDTAEPLAEASVANFNFPVGLLVDPKNENVYVADSHNDAIRKICWTTKAVSTVVCEDLREPHGLCWGPNGAMFIADTYHNSIKIIKDVRSLDVYAGQFKANKPEGSYHNGLAKDSLFSRPTSIVWHNDSLFVVDSHNMKVRQIYMGSKKNKKALMVKDLCGSMAYTNIYNDENAVIETMYDGPLKWPFGICIGPRGSLLVSDVSGISEIV